MCVTTACVFMLNSAVSHVKGTSGQQQDVIDKVCAIAAREERPNQPVMLAALLLCKPTTSKVHCQLQFCEHSAFTRCCVDLGTCGYMHKAPLHMHNTVACACDCMCAYAQGHITVACAYERMKICCALVPYAS